MFEEITRGPQARLILILEIFQAVGSREHEGNDINVPYFPSKLLLQMCANSLPESSSRKIWPKLYIPSFLKKNGVLDQSLDVVLWVLAGKNTCHEVRRVVSLFRLQKGSRTDGDRSRVGCSQHSRFHLPRCIWCIGECIGCIIENPYACF